ncbi:MAG TPA: site-specific integrase, partial [Gemmataceae bacterium]|nr:site-specific integrase [Gemmataceae bacterium]
MSARNRVSPARRRVGRVTLYLHHGAWWVYYRDGGKPVRRRVGADRSEAEQVAAQVNAQLVTGAPAVLSFKPVGLPQLRHEFLAHHEEVLRSSVATICRYRAATQHLIDFAARQPRPPQAHNVRPEGFAAYLRAVEIAPNGHHHTAKRRFRDKGVQFILETCRAMYSFAGRKRYLPPYVGNPFADLPLDRLKIQDAKPVFVFDSDTERAFLRAADAWAFAVHFTLAKTGLRVGELVHLLIEDVDLERGWLRVRNKSTLGWRVKTGNERNVPLISEAVGVLRRFVGARRAGPLFLRRRFENAHPLLIGDRAALEGVCQSRQRAGGASVSRAELLRTARTIWRDAGAVKADAIRVSFIRIMRAIGHPEATCPKSWRHTFATLLQDANVDPLVRQITLGHRPTAGTGLGMTAQYTHTRPETQRRQIEQALRQWPQSLVLATNIAKG